MSCFFIARAQSWLEARIHAEAEAESLLNARFAFQAEIVTRNVKETVLRRLEQMKAKATQKLMRVCFLLLSVLESSSCVISTASEFCCCLDICGQAQDKVTAAQRKLDEKSRNLCGAKDSKCDYQCNARIRLEVESSLEDQHGDSGLRLLRSHEVSDVDNDAERSESSQLIQVRQSSLAELLSLFFHVLFYSNLFP